MDGVGIADLGGDELVPGFHFDHRQIGIGIEAHHFGAVFLGAIHELHANPVGPFDDMVVGKNITGLIDHHAGAQCAGPLLRGDAAKRIAAEEAAQGVIAILVGGHRLLAPAASVIGLRLLLRQGVRLNMDHRGIHLLGDGGELIGQFNRTWNDQRCRTGRRIVVFFRSRTGIDQRTDDNSESQREENQRKRKQLLCAQLVNEFHGPLNSYRDGCCPEPNGFNSTNRTPLRMRAAPAAARPAKPSPTRMYEVTHATTGSSM